MGEEDVNLGFCPLGAPSLMGEPWFPVPLGIPTLQGRRVYLPKK